MKQRTTVLLLVIGLHVAVVWLLLSTTLRVPARAGSRSLQWLMLVPVTVPREPRTTAPDARTVRRGPEQRPPPAREPGPAMIENAPANEAIAAPIDWNAELNRAVANAAAAAAAPPPRDFGFPRPAEGVRKGTEFAWSRAHTHRIEGLEGGGLLIHLNDRCVLLLFPLPFVGCGIGKIPVNGTLFEHLHDPAHAGDWREP
jgi:hypothetical protein